MLKFFADFERVAHFDGLGSPENFVAVATELPGHVGAVLIGCRQRATLPAMEDVLELCRDLETVTFAPGEVLMPEGGKTGCLYFLISGSVRVTKGETPVTVIGEPGAIFGDLSILLDQPHPVTVEAAEETTCYVSGGGKDFLLANPRLALAVAELLALRLKGMISYLADLKNQYGDRRDHLGMVDELLLNLAHLQPKNG